MKKCDMSFRVEILFLTLLLVIGLSAVPAAADTDTETIRQLVERLDRQDKEIQMLKQKLESIEQKPPAETVNTKGLVTSGNETVELKLYGQVNRGILVTDDGTNTDVFHVDNDNSSTRIGLEGRARISDDLSAGAKIEVQFESNSTASIKQDDESVGPNNFTERHLDLFFESDRWGRLSMGQGDTASNGTSEVDLSGTALVGYSSVSDMAGGINFVNPVTGLLSGVSIGDVMTNMDGLGRGDRLRYDTPSFNGFTFSGSVVEDSKQDLAVRYSGKMSGAIFAAAAGYAHQDRSSTENQYNTSFSLLLDSGFNFTFAGGMRDIDAANREEPYFLYGKLGYIATLNSFGDTCFAFDYGYFEHILQNNDEAQSFGVFAVQNIKDAGVEFYIGYRLYDLDSTGIDYDSINALLLGSRIKF